MEWVFLAVIIFMLVDIEEKLDKICKNNDVLMEKDIHKKCFALEQYLHKKVSIIVDEDNDISDCHLFSAEQNIIGEIIDYDDEWVVFQFYNKQKKENVCQYLRINNIESIDEIS